ncbi:hypothetical protein [Stenotrophomonas phage RAS14]
MIIRPAAEPDIVPLAISSVNSRCCGCGGSSPEISPVPPPSPSVTRSVTITPTPTASATPTVTPSRTARVSPTPGATPTNTPYPSNTPQPTSAPTTNMVLPFIESDWTLDAVPNMSGRDMTWVPHNSEEAIAIINSWQGDTTKLPDFIEVWCSTTNMWVSIPFTGYPMSIPRNMVRGSNFLMQIKAKVGTKSSTSDSKILYILPSVTATPTLSQTRTPATSVTPTSTATPSVTPSVTATNTPSVTMTTTPSLYATPSVYLTPTLYGTPSPYFIPTISATPDVSATPSPTASATPSLSATPSVTAGATPSPTATVTASITPTVSNSGTPGATPSNTPTGTSAVTPTNSATPSVTATITPTISNSGTPAATPDPSATATPTVTASVSVTASVTPSTTPSLSATPSVTAGATPSPTASVTPTITPTVSNSGTPDVTPSNTPSVTAEVTPTNSATPSVTATITPTVSNSGTPASTPDPSATATPTVTASISVTASITPSTTPTLTATPSVTAAVTPSVTPSPSALVVLPFLDDDWTFYFDPYTTLVRAMIDINSWQGTLNPKPDQILWQTIAPNEDQLWRVYADFKENPELDWPRHMTLSGIGLQPGETYLFRIKAVVNGIESVYSEKGGVVPPFVSVTPTITPSVSISNTPTPTPTPSVTPSGIPDVILNVTDVAASRGVIDQPYASQLNASGGNGIYTYSIWSGGLPQGLTLDISSGVISGVPTAAGSYEIGVRVDSGSKYDVEMVTIYVYQETLDMWFGGAKEIETTSNIEVTVNPSGGIAPYTFSAPSVTPENYPELVFDDTVDPQQPYFYGYIRTPGTHTIPVTMVDSVGGSFTKELVFIVTEAPDVSPTPTPTPSITPSMTPVPTENTLYYIESNVSDSVPSDNARASDTTGLIHDDKLMVRNSYFLVEKDENGNEVEQTSKIITLDHADELNKFTIALLSDDGYNVTKLAYTGPNSNPDIKYSNFSFLPRSNSLILAESNVADGTYQMHMWELTENNLLDWSTTPVGQTLPIPTKTVNLSPLIRNVLLGTIDRLYVDKAYDDETNTLHDRIYFITKTTASVDGEVLIMTAINRNNGDGTFTIQNAPARYLGNAGEFIGSTSQPPNPNFTVIFTVNVDDGSADGFTSKIIAKRYESLIGSDFIVSDVSAYNLPTFTHITTSADFTKMLASSYNSNIIYAFDPYTFEYISESGQIVDGQPTTVVNYDYIRTNIVPTNSHTFWDATTHSPWAKLNIVNYDNPLMNMTYLHYDVHRMILRAQSWKYSSNVNDSSDVTSTYIGFIGIRDTIPVLPSPTPTSSPMSSPTATPTQTAAVTPSQTASITPTVTPTISFSPSSTPAVTPSGTPAVTPSQTASVTPTVTQTVTPSNTVTPSAQASPTPTPSPVPQLVLDVLQIPEEGMVKIPYEGQLSVTGGPNPNYIFTIDPSKPLPDGLVVNMQSGAVTGTPTTIGTYTVGFRVESTPVTTQVDKVITINIFDASFDGMQYTTQPEDFKNTLDGTEMPAEPSEGYDAGEFQ